MSTTATKRALMDAQRDAIDFKCLFEGCYERWEFAGSVRRRKAQVGDVEHVVIPQFGLVEVGGLFAEKAIVNLLWHRLDQLVSKGKLNKHIYDAWEDDISGQQHATHRWGEKYRGIDFRGFNHEIFTAEAQNFGSIFAIRTGPADYSKALVERMLRGGVYRQQGGRVVHVESRAVVPTPDEQTFFKLCCAEFIEPERRI